jgi:acyl-coenzyme A synthetase/AMP-(fatty) acid ligase
MAAIFFTSGSTGQAKGVVYTAGMLNWQIQVTKSQFNILADEIDLCTFPLLGLFAICHGNSSVLADMDMTRPAKLDPARIIRNIQDFGCTRMFGSPMVLNKLAQYGTLNDSKLYSLKRVISAGAPVHRKVLESFSRLMETGAEIHTPYGATEVLPVTDICASELFRFDANETENEMGICIGYPVKGLAVKIIEITDRPIISWNNANQLPVNGVGEIAVMGPWVTREYFNNPEAERLAKIFDREGLNTWHRMGDIGRFDDQGRLWFYGRKAHRVITPEGTLFTIPCEAVFNRHPRVARSALVGIPLPGIPGLKRPVICVQTEPGNRPSKKLIRELLDLGSSSELTKGISKILFFDRFPVDPRHNAKIYREKLADWVVNKVK